MKHFGRVSRRGLSVLCLLALLATSFSFAAAQRPAAAKRPLTHQDYDAWHSIVSEQISRDGKFVAYAYMAQDGDSEIVARNLASGAEWRAPRGYRAKRLMPQASRRCPQRRHTRASPAVVPASVVARRLPPGRPRARAPTTQARRCCRPRHLRRPRHPTGGDGSCGARAT